MTGLTGLAPNIFPFLKQLGTEIYHVIIEAKTSLMGTLMIIGGKYSGFFEQFGFLIA